jgi:NADP-dependent 3-hydroxy acid dehydrogenase YdfG
MLKDRVAIITGASSGIGEATARLLAAEGAKVVLAARRADRTETLARRIVDDGGEALAMPLDVTESKQSTTFVEAVRERFSRIDLLVNNAGVMLLAPVAEALLEEWRHMIDLNLLGLMSMTKAVLPIMKAGGGGHIINIASLAGRIANPGASGYAATKFGVVGFSESLRREVYRDRIRVTVVEPGIVATELGEHITNAAMKAGLRERVAAMEPLRAEDVARAVVFAAAQPMHVSINEIVMRPTGQER